MIINHTGTFTRNDIGITMRDIEMRAFICPDTIMMMLHVRQKYMSQNSRMPTISIG